MNKRTLAALRGSIKKWHNICYNGELDRGTYDCPLCIVFKSNTCQNCPVKDSTGEARCIGSPYSRWHLAGGHYNIADVPGRQRAAKDELDFLVTLLPENKTCKVDGWVYYWTWEG